MAGWAVIEWLIAIATVLTAGGVIWRKGLRPLIGFVRRFKAWMDRVESAVSWTETQMKPNGGSSLTDKVDKLTRDVATLLQNTEE